MKRLIVASRNPAKVREIRAVIRSLGGWRIEPLPDGAPEVEETGASFVENAVQKAEFYGGRLGGWTLADDSGLEVDALEGRPGIYSSRYAPTDRERIDRLLEELEGVAERDRGARFVCALALALQGETVWTVEETVEGRIAPAPRGTHGFGYDPVFWIPSLGRTMADLEPRMKNRISHRGRALIALEACLERLHDVER